MRPKKIVITGGPGTGKTSLIRDLEGSGFFCYHEIIRDLTSEAIDGADPAEFRTNPLAFVDDPFAFNRRILDGRLQQFNEASESEENLVFFDRGIPDVLAYMDYFDQQYNEEFIQVCRIHKYDEVIILPPWEKIYKSDNERFESFEEATALHLELIKTYEFFDYNPISLPTGSLEERSKYLKDLLLQ